jgi:hypothetical protein
MAELQELANLLQRRNEIDKEISRIIGRPSTIGHLGEFVASKIFGIKLESSATTKGIDGVFAEGPLKGRAVNIKWYGKQEGILDVNLDNLADYALVITGPKSVPLTSKGTTRPLVISYVYLFDMVGLVSELRQRAVKIGIATSVKKSSWDNAEIYPKRANKKLELTEEQRKTLELFSG